MENLGMLRAMKVAALAADGFEQAELTRPMRRLSREGAEVKVISLAPGHIRGMNLMWRGKRVRVDETIGSARADDHDALLLPGGLFSADTLRQSQPVLELVRDFERARKPIAVMCHGAWRLISAGLTRGHQIAGWPGIADDIVNSGASWVDEPVVQDGNWVSSRGPKDLRHFNDAMVDLFADHRVQRATSAAASPPRLAAPPRRRLGLGSLVSLATSALSARRGWQSARR